MLSQSILEKIGKHTILNLLDHSERESVISGSSLLTYKTGDQICTEEGGDRALFFIIEGSVDVFKAGVHLASLHEGDYFGEMALLNHLVREATVIATAHVLVLAVSEEIFETKIKPSNAVICEMLRIYDERLRKHNLLVIEQFQKLKVQYHQLEETHKELLQSSKLAEIGMLTSSMAHEINNPLLVISGTLNILKKRVGQKDQTAKDEFLPHLERSLRACESIETLIKNLKTYLRSETVVSSSLNFNEAIMASTDLVSYLYKKEGIDISIELDKRDVLIWGNLGHLQQIVINLLSNAKDALDGQNNKSISVKTLVQDGFAELTISDSGIGIPKENLEKIFERFFSTKEIGKGTGLGLDIVNSLVQTMKGKIHVESVQGEGTTFKLSFPRFEG